MRGTERETERENEYMKLQETTNRKVKRTSNDTEKERSVSQNERERVI